MTETLAETVDVDTDAFMGDEEFTGTFGDLARSLRHQMISGGKPYILIVVDPDTADAVLEHYRFQPDSITEALEEVARVFRDGEATLVESGRA